MWLQQGKDPSSSEVVEAIQGQQAACNNQRDTMGIHSSSSTIIYEGVCVKILAFDSTMDPMQVFFRRALLVGQVVAQKGEWLTSGIRPVELQQLARPKGCFTTYYIRSVDELSGRTTG